MLLPVIRITPSPVLVDLGLIQIGWYGLGYVIALAVLLLVTQREVERRGIAPAHVWNATLFVGALALIGGRLYHVIDELEFYAPNPLSIILPPYSGLGLFGGVLGAGIGILIYARRKGLSLRLAVDAVIPGTLFAQGIARWGNFFNQELYGPPTDAPWGIAIECAHRVAQYSCEQFPFATTGFHPLFFYESALNIAGGFLALYISRRFLHRLQPLDLAAFWAIWYGTARSLLETFREGYNWTLGGIATAQRVGIGLIIFGIAVLAWNHRPGNPPYDYPAPYEPPEYAPPVEEDSEPDEEFEPDEPEESEDDLEPDDEVGHGSTVSPP